MKPVIPCLLLAAGLAYAQGGFTYQDKNTTVRAKDGLLTHPGALYHVVLSGGVSMSSVSQGLKVHAERVTADIVGVGIKGQEAKVKTATATGGAHVEQVVTGEAGKRSTIDASKAVYVSEGTGGVVTLSGPVKI